MVQGKYFLLTPTRNMYPGKFVKWVTFLVVLLEYIFYNFQSIKVLKMSEVFWAKPIVKWVIFFANFCWIWDFLLEKLKLIDKLPIWGFESYLLSGSNLVFWNCFMASSHCNFKNLCRRPTMVNKIFTPPPHHKEASYDSAYTTHTASCWIKDTIVAP